MYNYRRIYSNYNLMYNGLKWAEGSIKYVQDSDKKINIRAELIPIIELDALGILSFREDTDWKYEDLVTVEESGIEIEQETLNQLLDTWIFLGLSSKEELSLVLRKEAHEFDLQHGNRTITYTIVHEKASFDDSETSPQKRVFSNDGRHFSDISADMNDEKIIDLIKKTVE